LLSHSDSPPPNLDEEGRVDADIGQSQDDTIVIYMLSIYLSFSSLMGIRLSSFNPF